MNKTNVTAFFRSVQKSVSKHSPQILTGVGIGGMVAATVLAVQATPKAIQLVERKKKEENVEKLTAIETVKTTWKCYIPTVITSAASIACIIGASSINAKRHAALISAYALSETALREYQEKVVETIGEKKEKTVRDKVAEKQIKENPVSNNEVIVTGNGDTLCYDPMSGRYFNSSVEKIKRAENELNRKMLHDIFGYASLNEFYDEVGLPNTDVGDSVGWTTDNLVDIDISTQVAENGKPSLVLVYRSRPDYNFDSFA